MPKVSAYCDAARPEDPGHYWAEGDLPLLPADLRRVPDACGKCGGAVRFRSLPPAGFHRLPPPHRLGAP